MKSKYVIPVLILVLVWLGVMVSFGVRGAKLTDPRVAAYHSVFGGLRQPTAKIYRVSWLDIEPDKLSSTPHLHGYEILEEKVLMPEGFSEVLERLTRRGTYSRDGNKCFMPGMAVRFSGDGGEEISAVICLKCLWVEWIRFKKRDRIPLSEAGKNGLLEFYKKHFPNAKNDDE